ncbi:l-ascorbate oxidase-like protein [Hordeum vulgare]|nr:l-ascorbate oxidase-like protein [Hordeum vulgare]
MVRGRGRPPLAARAARGSRSDHATTLGATASGSPVDRGGRGSRGRGRRGRGLGRRSAAPTSSPSPTLVPAGTHVKRTPLEFLVQLRGRIRNRLKLPHAFARAMEEEKPPVLWLRVHGCGNGTVPVAVEHPGPRLLFLGRGWKSFARAHNLSDGHVLRFKMTADNLLSIKLYGS